MHSGGLKIMKKRTKLFILEETARYEIPAKSAQEAERKFLKKISCPFPTEVLDRDVWEDCLGLTAGKERQQL